MAVLRFFVLAFVLSTSGAIRAQVWPAKSVRLIISNSAGAAPDVVARLVADRLSRSLGQSVVVDNRPGGESVLGAELAARSEPDGYTLYMANQIVFAINPHTIKSLPYDPVSSFTPVALVIDTAPFALAVHPEVPAATLAELLVYAKGRPGKLSYGTTVAVQAMLGEWLNRHAGVKMVEVRYKNVAQAVQDGLAGRTQVMINSLITFAPHVKSGKLRLIAVTSAERLPDWNALPTVAETYPGFQMQGWQMLVSPAGTPHDIVARLNREMNVIVREPEFLWRLGRFGWNNVGGARTPQGIEEFSRVEMARWRKMIEEIGLKPQ